MAIHVCTAMFVLQFENSQLPVFALECSIVTAKDAVGLTSKDNAFGGDNSVTPSVDQAFVGEHNTVSLCCCNSCNELALYKCAEIQCTVMTGMKGQHPR